MGESSWLSDSDVHGNVERSKLEISLMCWQFDLHSERFPIFYGDKTAQRNEFLSFQDPAELPRLVSACGLWILKMEQLPI